MSEEEANEATENAGESEFENEQESSGGRTAAVQKAQKNQSQVSQLSAPVPRKPTEENAMHLTPDEIIERLTHYYKIFINLRQQKFELEKEFGKLDRKRNRWKATNEELKLRIQKKKQLNQKMVEFCKIKLKIKKLLEAAAAKEIKPEKMPPEPPPLDEDDEDECLPDDILPRVIVCGTEKSGKMADVPKIVVVVEDSCKPPPDNPIDSCQGEQTALMEDPCVKILGNLVSTPS